jgi:misacylated tRNA(Ala) deacylase
LFRLFSLLDLDFKQHVRDMAQACIVGALACQRNSYLRSLRTKVVSCTKYDPGETQKASRSKERLSKDAASGTVTPDLSESWLIEFEDSVLFPEGISRHLQYGIVS